MFCKEMTISTVLILTLILMADVVNADFTFSEPVNLGVPVNSTTGDFGPCPSADGLSLYFCSNRSGGYDAYDLWVATRPTMNDPWQEPNNLGPVVNSTSWDSAPCISPDGLSLYFQSNRSGNWDIWVTTRADKDADWGAPVNIGLPINTSNPDCPSSISADGLSFYYDGGREGGYGWSDIWVARRATIDDPWGEPENLGPTINTEDHDAQASISSDGLILFFFCSRPENIGGGDLWYSRRLTTSDPWGPPVNLGETVNSSVSENYPSISADGKTLYFSTEELPGGIGSYDQWQVSIDPVVDFNVDGIVDAADMCIMIEHWLTDYPLCDIGPMPWGDGIVDVQDLIVLAEHLFEEIHPTEPVD
jgi:Tol biopolymer transport system component